MLIDSYHKYVTRQSKLRVRIYATDGGDNYPVHGAIYSEVKGVWEPQTWTEDGYTFEGFDDHPTDLV
jgi:hypothetical protein